MKYLYSINLLVDLNQIKFETCFFLLKFEYLGISLSLFKVKFKGLSDPYNKLLYMEFCYLFFISLCQTPTFLLVWFIYDLCTVIFTSSTILENWNTFQISFTYWDNKCIFYEKVNNTILLFKYLLAYNHNSNNLFNKCYDLF